MLSVSCVWAGADNGADDYGHFEQSTAADGGAPTPASAEAAPPNASENEAPPDPPPTEGPPQPSDRERRLPIRHIALHNTAVPPS